MPHPNREPLLKLWTRPDSYIGETFEGYYVGPSVHRDSDILQKSNFDAALKMLGGESSEGRDVVVASSSHWAVGWLDEIFVHKDAADKVAILEDILERIADYPVLDEDDYRQRESEANDENYKDYGRDEALKILGFENKKLTKADEKKLWEAWSDAQTGSSDDPSTSEETLRESAKRLGLVK